MRAEQKRSAAALHRRAHELLAFDRDVEQLVAPACEIQPVENGDGECKHLPVPLAERRLTAECALQGLLPVATGARSG